MRKLSHSNLEFTTLKVTNPHEYVFHVQLNRPEKRNAMNPKFFEFVHSQFHKFEY